MARRPDGRLVIAGTADWELHSDLLVAQVDADGAWDTSFGVGGAVLTDVAGSTNDDGLAMLLQPDGAAVVTGSTWTTTGEIVLARIDSGGALDTVFATNGILRWNLGAQASGQAIGIQTNGDYVIGGRIMAGSYHDFALVRGTDSGLPDAGFGGGLVQTSFGYDDGALALGVMSDDRVVAAGVGEEDFALSRYATNGTLDATFGTGGRVVTDIAGDVDVIEDLVLLPQGALVAVGSAVLAGDQQMAAARYTAAGALDATFGVAGRVTLGSGDAPAAAHAVALDPLGRIVLADGAVDASFGAGGVARYDFGGSDDVDNDLLIQPDGRIVVVGRTTSASRTRAFLLRVHP